MTSSIATLVSSVFALLILAGCGGSGSDALSPLGPEDTTIPSESPDGATDLPPTIDDTVPTADDSENSGSESTDVNGPIPGLSVSGRRINVLVADDALVPDTSYVYINSSLDGADVPVIDPAGFIIYSAAYSALPNANAVGRSVWAGPVAAPQRILSEETSLPDLPSTAQFARLGSFDIGSDGSAALVTKLGGSRDNFVLFEWVDGLLQNVAESGIPLDTQPEGMPVETFGTVSRSAAGTTFVADGVLWLRANGTFTPITAPEESLAMIGACAIEFRNLGVHFHWILDSGEIIFDARLEAVPGGGDCDEGDAIVRYGAGGYQVVARDKEAVPGAPSSSFRRVEAVDTFPNGTVLIRASVETTGLSFIQWSYWLYPSNGSPQLIAIQGETLEIGLREVLLGLEPSTLSVTDSGNIVYRQTLENAATNGPIILAGLARQGQPYPNLAALGRTTLTVRADTETALPIPFNEDEFLFGTEAPAIDNSGTVTFVGTTSRNISSGNGEDGVWQIGEDGVLVRLIGAEDEVLAGPDDVRPVMPLLTQSTSGVEDSRIMPMNDGGLVIYSHGDFINSTAASIVYVAP